MKDQLVAVAVTYANTQQTQQKKIQELRGIRTFDPQQLKGRKPIDRTIVEIGVNYSSVFPFSSTQAAGSRQVV
jgi:hypothetical protein